MKATGISGVQATSCSLRPILVASSNRGKISEIESILGPILYELGFDLKMPSDFGITGWSVDETGDTFVQNAVLKASTLAQSSGMAAIGEDSGLCVDALGGAPGVRSARWHEGDDADRNMALLKIMRDVPIGQRSARFVSAVAIDFGANRADAPSLRGVGRTVIAEAACEGEIAVSPAGDSGFGYDPVFLIPSLGRTFAQIGIEEKNRLSHRRKALEALAQKSFSVVGVESVTDGE